MDSDEIAKDNYNLFLLGVALVRRTLANVDNDIT